MGGVGYLDTVLVPLSVFIMVGYHAYLWHNYKNRPSVTTIGIDSLKRKDWLLGIQERNDKKEMLAVQSLRNKLMDTILASTLTIMLNIAIAALASTSYNASKDIFMNITFLPFIFGSQSSMLVVLKYGLSTMLISTSFICSSMGVGFLVDSNFLINANSGGVLSKEYVGSVLERGFMMAIVGTRVLCIGVCFMLWMLSPWVVALASVLLVWGFYEIDFPSCLRRRDI